MMRPSVKSIPADPWQVRERIPPDMWGESTVKGRVERGDHRHPYPECCFDALKRGTIVEGSQASKLAQLVQERYVDSHRRGKPISAVHHSMGDDIGWLAERLQDGADRRPVAASNFYRSCLQAPHSCLPSVEE